MQPITLAEINATKLINTNAKKWCADNLDYLNKPIKFFGSSLKVEKGADKYDTYIMYLQPADKVATDSLCKFAELAGCKEPCLISSGQLGMSTGQNAATKRTVLMILRPLDFSSNLLSEIDKAERKALKTGIPALFRLNGTSDIDFSEIMAQRPDSMFYDYTKIPNRKLGKIQNYDLTYSYSGVTKYQSFVDRAIKDSMRMAVVFEKYLPKTFKGLKVVNGDDTDIRPYDAQGVVVGLLAKGKARQDTSGFVVRQSN